jgi:hypothetical protein
LPGNTSTSPAITFCDRRVPSSGTENGAKLFSFLNTRSDFLIVAVVPALLAKVYSDSFSVELLGAAPREESNSTHTKITTAKDRRAFALREGQIVFKQPIRSESIMGSPFNGGSESY